MATTTFKTKLVRPLRGGQITIPVEFRRLLGIDEDTMLRMTLVDGELRVKPVQVQVEEESEGSPGLWALYQYYAPVREEILARGIPEEEVYADIDAAIAAVRAEKRSQMAQAKRADARPD
jgi:bifunctional DNA-binding transcriptional regulator/antitoxin component of YhaV-PrlF toxin-antitoxin module